MFCDLMIFPTEKNHQIIKFSVVRVLILRGEGAAFCAGYDFKDPSNNKANQPFLQHALSGVIKKLREMLGWHGGKNRA